MTNETIELRTTIELLREWAKSQAFFDNFADFLTDETTTLEDVKNSLGRDGVDVELALSRVLTLLDKHT